MILARWPEYRMFPYERRLAELEARSLGSDVVNNGENGLELSRTHVEVLKARATYFSTVETQDLHLETNQASVETAHFSGSDRSRQATRYGPHGLHEYKGKFNPQIVRAFINITDADADLLVDPFCGSGTALVEALRLGVDTFGLDRSPVAHFIARVKVDLSVEQGLNLLQQQFIELTSEVAYLMKEAQETDTPASLDGLVGREGVAYLKHWFTVPAYAALSQALRVLLPRRDSLSGRLALTALSAILREVSLQLPEDLRIRRRPDSFVAPPLWEEFQDACSITDRAIGEVAAWDPPRATATVRLGSITQVDDLSALAEARRRLVITSPPYAMALPYIDTDRLSLVALGLTSPEDLRNLERELIGSREWLKAEATSWQQHLAENTRDLPTSVVELARRIQVLNEESGTAGFRKQAIPGLLYRYFSQMATGLRNLARYQGEDERAVFIVGSNRTKAGGEQVAIPTPELLADVAETCGYAVDEIHELDTWPRYGLHHANAVQSERAVVLRRLA